MDFYLLLKTLVKGISNKYCQKLVDRAITSGTTKVETDKKLRQKEQLKKKQQN